MRRRKRRFIYYDETSCHVHSLENCPYSKDCLKCEALLYEDIELRGVLAQSLCCVCENKILGKCEETSKACDFTDMAVNELIRAGVKIK